jgi:type IV secretory pathway VirB10-like protein
MSSGQSQTRIKRPSSGRPPRPTTAKQNPAGLVISLALHAGLLVATFLTWNRMVELSQETHAVPVELIVEQQTNVRAEAPPPQPDKPLTQTVQMDEPKLPQFVDAEPAPLPPIPQIKIIKPKVNLDQPDQPKSKKQILQDADAVLNKILAQAKTPKNAKTSDRIIQGAGNQSLATADLADALKSQIYRCWAPPVGAPNANDLVVDFDLQLNPDGTVMGRPQLSGSSASAMGNPYTRAAAEAASRAIYQCAPYNLPAKRYSDWREINPLRFDPRDMMGQ